MPYQTSPLCGLAAAALMTVATAAGAGPTPHLPVGPALAESDGPWQVTGTTADGTFEMRTRPAAGARVVARLPDGQVVHNHGCETAGGVLWCRVVTLGRTVQGWVPGSALRRVPGPVAVSPDAPGVRRLEGGGVETTFANGCTVRHNRRGARVLETISCLRPQLAKADAAARAVLRGRRPVPVRG